MKTMTRSEQLLHEYFGKVNISTDRMFLWLMIAQYLGGILAAVILTPTTISGGREVIHPHVISAVFLGLLIEGPAVFLILWKPGHAVTRFTISVCQMLMSSLLIHLSGGRIETHFHVFGSLAFLSFYRDWRILIPSTLVVALDHLLRGVYLPMSVYGVPSGAEFRFIEHAGWVVFEDIFLVLACLRGSAEARLMSERQAEVEEAKAVVETAVLKRTEELRHSELNKTAIFNNALDGIAMFEADGTVTELNQAAMDMFQIAPGTQCELSDLVELDSSLGDGPKTWVLGQHIEWVGRRTNGETFPLEMATSRVTLGNRECYTAIFRDQSERKQMQFRLNQATKLESLGNLAVGVAHEINTPNQYIGDNIVYVTEAFRQIGEFIENAMPADGDSSPEAEALRAKAEKLDMEFHMEEVPAALNQALDGVSRVGTIVQAMKEFAHPGTSAFTTLNVNHLLENTMTVTRNEWKSVAATNLNLDPDLPTMQGHSGELGQVFLNLIVNACHAIADNHSGTLGQLTISSRLEGEEIVVEIADDGAGIPDTVRDKIFDPFFTTKGVGIGTGQGLSVVHNIIVRNHGGHVGFTTEVGQGTTFHVRLPLRPAAEVESAA